MSKLALFEITGPAGPGRTRAAGLLDFLAATIVAMIVVPQPVVRQALMNEGATVLTIAAFVAVLLLAILVVFAVYLAFSAVTWGRTPSMYLLDLALEAPTKPTLGEALSWGGAWAVAVLPALVGVRGAYDPDTGLPARLSGLPTRSTAAS